MRRILAVAATIFLAAGVGGWAFAASQAPQTSNGWILYHHPTLENSSTYTVQYGRAADGSCKDGVHESTQTLSPGGPGVAEQEVAFNPATCQARWERGIPAQGASEPSPEVTMKITSKTVNSP